MECSVTTDLCTSDQVLVRGETIRPTASPPKVVFLRILIKHAVLGSACKGKYSMHQRGLELTSRKARHYAVTISHKVWTYTVFILKRTDNLRFKEKYCNAFWSQEWFLFHSITINPFFTNGKLFCFIHSITIFISWNS